MKICLRLDEETITATLLDSAAARDFAKLLPLTLTMNDLFGREKYGHLPRAISEDGRRAGAYEVGQIAYWPPGRDVAVITARTGRRSPHLGSSFSARSTPAWSGSRLAARGP